MHQVDTSPCNNQVRVERSTQNISSDRSVVAPANSIATIPSSTTPNRTYLQCYSREANKNLVSWADQMSLALRDSVAHLDQICMRVRSCLSDLEANEIRYLHMQRRPSPMQSYQSVVTTSLLEPLQMFAVTPDCHRQEPDDKEVELDTGVSLNLVEVTDEAPIEIESLPDDTPVIVEPIAVQETAKPPGQDLPRRPQSRRGGNLSRGGSACSSSRSCTPGSPKASAKPSKIASIKTSKPIISVREHLELTKNSTTSRQVYKKIFRNKSQSTTAPQIMRLSTPPQISRPVSILKAANKFATKPPDNIHKLSSLCTTKNTTKNKENYKFSDSLWFKDKKVSQAKLQDQCGCKVIVECPRVPTFSTPRTSYNAQSRLQWIRAKNSLVLEYNGKQQRQAAVNKTSSSCTSADGGPRPNPVDILDAINDDLVQPLKSEYPRKDNSVSVLSLDNGAGLGSSKDGDGDELLRELLQDPKKLKGLVRSSSRRSLAHNFNHAPQLRNPRPTPVIKLPSSPYAQQQQQELLTNSARLHMLRKQHKRKQQQLKKKQKEDVKQRQEQLVQKQLQMGSKVKLLENKIGEAGDLMMGKRSKDTMTGKGSGRGSRSGSNHSGGREDKENAVPLGQRRDSEAGFSTWSNMSAHEIKTKLMPFLIPDQRSYTVLPVTEIIYDRKPPVSGLPPTTITKGGSSAHLNSTQPSNFNMFRRVKPRGLYTDAKTQRKLDSYLELRDCSSYPRPMQPTVYTALPAVTITTARHPSAAPFSGSARHSAYHHHSNNHHTNPRRQSTCSQSTTTTNTSEQRGGGGGGSGSGSASTHHRRHCTASGSVIAVAPHTTAAAAGRYCTDTAMSVDMEQLGGGLSCGWLDKAKRAKTAISAATRRDIGSSIKQLEDKIAELISDPSKIGDGKAFDDVEQDIVRMLNKINTPHQVTEVATTTTDDLLKNQVGTQVSAEVEPPSNITATVSDVTICSAIDLVQTSQITDFSEVMKTNIEDSKKKEVPIFCKSYHMGDSTPLEQRKFTPVDYNDMVITSGLKKVERIQDQENKSPHKSPRKEPAMQPIFENIEPISTIKLEQDISAVGSPRRVFKVENIPEYVSVDSSNEIANFPYVTNVKKQHRDDSADSKLSLTGPELKKLKKLDGSSGKPDQDFIVSTDNLCSIESDQFVTPFMKVVRKYRQEETHDNFLQFLEALTQLSQDNALVSGELLNNSRSEIKDLSNPFYSDMKITAEMPNAATEQKLQRVSAIEVTSVNQQQQQHQRCGLKNEARAVLKKTDNICSQLVEYILKRCKTYIDKRLVLEYKCQSTTLVGYKYKWEEIKIKPRGIVLRFVYTVLFAVVFMAMKWNWNCIN